MTELRTTIDLSYAEKGALALRDRLLALRRKYDLLPYEYCKEIRIAPYTIPFSHPVVTLNTYFPNENDLLSTYVHEQLHWYVTWYSFKHTGHWHKLIAALESRYPDAPAGGAEGGDTKFSTYLHLIVNWLEVDAISSFIGEAAAKQHAAAKHYYRWIYGRVLEDRQKLGDLYGTHLLTPVVPAQDMSAEDLALAARSEEA